LGLAAGLSIALSLIVQGEFHAFVSDSSIRRLVSRLFRFGLNELGNDREGLGFGKSMNGRTLGVYAEAGALLSLRGNPQICDDPLHVQRAYHRLRFGRSANKSNVIAVFLLHQHRSKTVSLLPNATLWGLAGASSCRPYGPL
jgi:hypothetical protein